MLISFDDWKSMIYYVEITLLPNIDLNLFKLWSYMFEQIHLGIVENHGKQKYAQIGLSFPEYQMGERHGILGSKCRLFSTDETILQHFFVPHRLKYLNDYVHFTRILQVPQKVKNYAIYSRVQPKTNPMRLARRYAKRHDMDFENALNADIELQVSSCGTEYPSKFRYCDMSIPSPKLPFIRLKSFSSKRDFRLWIVKNVVTEPILGSFNSYGLSRIATVPEF